MAIDIPVENDPVASSKIATWRAEFETPSSAPPEEYYLRGHRQIVDTKQSGATAVRPAPNAQVTRTLAQLADQQFTADGITVTGTQLFKLVGAAIDQIDTEEIEEAAARKAGATNGSHGR